MSWTTGFGVDVEGDYCDRDLAKLEATGQEGDEVERALEAGRQAAAALIRSGALGHPGNTFHVTLSGHVNPDNKPRAGWASDSISISVWQK